MAKISAYSSVSVIDVSDLGSISFYLTSNQPTSVIYDPNTNNGTYTPDWSTSNLVITPVISYNGSNLPLNSSGLVIEYHKQEVSGSRVSIGTGETVASGVLTVGANKLSNVSSGLLTYICTVTYTDPDVGVPIVAEANLSYSLVSMATELKDASISGETTFLYDTNKAIVGTGIITLTATTKNVNINQWKYKNSSGNFVAFPTTHNNAINTNTLSVYASEANIWLNEKMAVIKLTTNDANVYDIVQINKIYDGSAGNSTVAAVLSNENHVLPVSANGTPKSWNGSATEIKIYEGGQDVTSQWTITVANGTGLSGSYNSSTKTYTPSALTQDSSYADFTCKRTGYSDIVKRYTISKQYQGIDGTNAVFHEIVADTYALNLSEQGVFTPSSVTFSAFEQDGDSTKTSYSGRMIISESTDGETYVSKYTSSTDEYQKVYTPTANTVVSIRCVLYQAGGTTIELDSQTVVITKDGVTGQNGTNGTDGLSMGLGNYSDVIPCTTGKVSSAVRDITIPYYAYKGITRVAVTAVVGTLPTGVTVQSNTAGTTSADGVLVLRVASGATFGGTTDTYNTGDITITLTAVSKSVDYKYTWTKNNQATNGTNAVLLQLYSEDGGTVEKGRSTTIKVMMYSGTTSVTPTSVSWAAFSSGSYQTITGQTGTSITITDAMVTDQMWLRCTATYGGKNYTAYYTIDDITDDLTAYTFATVEKFTNSMGFGAIYTRVYRNGTEVDPIRSTTFSDTAPTTSQNGDFYYHLDAVNRTCKLKKYNGTEWVNATETDSLTYNYYRMDNKGNALDTTLPWKTDRCIYIDPSMINGRMQFICEVIEN